MDNLGERKTTKRIVQTSERMTNRRREEERRKQKQKEKQKDKKGLCKNYCKNRKKREKIEKVEKVKLENMLERRNAIIERERKWIIIFWYDKKGKHDEGRDRNKFNRRVEKKKMKTR